MEESSGARYATPLLRHVARQLLALETAGAPPTSEHLAAASGRLLERLSQELAEVVGPAGVEAIFRRAVKLLQPEFAFLDERVVPGDDRASLPVCSGLQGYEPEVIRDASVTLFATFAGLLANVVGDRLTWSLLQQIWPQLVLPGPNFQEIDE
jgi:hypothetical protein